MAEQGARPPRLQTSNKPEPAGKNAVTGHGPGRKAKAWENTDAHETFARTYVRKGMALGAEPLHAPIQTPTDVNMCAGERVRTARRWTERRYGHVIHVYKLNKGGHVAALERPALFGAEVGTSFGTAR